MGGNRSLRSANSKCANDPNVARCRPTDWTACSHSANKTACDEYSQCRWDENGNPDPFCRHLTSWDTASPCFHREDKDECLSASKATRACPLLLLAFVALIQRSGLRALA